MLAYNNTAKVSFAGQNVTIPPYTLKINFAVYGWPFLRESDKLAVTFKLSFPGKLDGYELDNTEAMNWINLNITNFQVYPFFFFFLA
jgi:hypothetical protein